MVIEWQAWGREVFERAACEKKPVLLYLESPSRISSLRAQNLCRHPDVAQVITARYVPCRVPAEERPDVAARYDNLANGPLAALRSNSGAPAFFSLGEPAALSHALLDFAQNYDGMEAEAPPSSGPVWNGAVGSATPLEVVPTTWPESVLTTIKEQPAGAFPCLDCLELLLYAAAEWNDDAAQRLVLSRLELLAKGNFCDKARAGFSAPDNEKTLPLNARLARIYWDAYALMRRPELLETGTRTLDFMLCELYSPSLGAFVMSRADAEARKYYADANAMAAMALARAGAFGEAQKYREPAQRLMELFTQWFDPYRGVAHVWDGAQEACVWGLLNDSAWVMLALTESFLSGGPTTHRDFADRILKHLFQETWEREHGGFQDHPTNPDDFGALKNPLIPVHGNAVAFEAAWRLHQLKGNSHYRQWVEYGTRFLIGKSKAAGCAAAPLARVLDIILRGRLDFELVGRLGESRTEQLLAALNQHYLPRKIISFVNPDDQDYIQAHRLTSSSLPALFACANLKPTAAAHTPEEVPGLLK